jgi:potassium efflux system protein
MSHMQRSSSCRRVQGWILLLCTCLFTVPASAADPATAPATQPATTQATTAPATTAPTAPAIPEPPKAPFNLTDAATEAESVSISLRGVEADLNGDRPVTTVQEELPILTSEIDARSDESAKLLASSPSLQLLDSQEQDWAGISQSLGQWKRITEQRRDQLNQLNKTVTDLQNRWGQERALLDYWIEHGKTKEARQLLDTASATVLHVQEQIDATLNDLHDARLKTAQLEQAVDVQDARALDMLDSIRRARHDAFSRLFVRTGPALWNVPLRSQDVLGIFAQGQNSFARQLQAVAAYIQRRYANVGLQAALLVVLAAGLFRLRKMARQWAEKDVALEPVTRAFAAPIATALVLSFLLSLWIYPLAPRMLQAMIGAAALIPTVVILRRLMDRRLFPVLNALVVFYFLDQLRDIVAVVPVVARFLLMLEMLGGAALLALFIRSTRQEGTSGRLWNAMRLVGWAWTAAFILAFLGAVAGYVSLAELIGDAALGSAYLAVILYACTRVADSFLIVALRSRPVSLLKMVRQHQLLMLRRLRLVLYWIASAAWVVGALASLSLAAPAWNGLRTILSLQLNYGSIHLSLGHVLAFALAIFLSVWVSRLLRFVLEEDVYDRFPLPEGIPYAISKMVNYVVLLIGFFMGISALGYDMTKFTILAGAFGVGLGFGMQNIVNNFVSGLILLFERPVRVGDVIQLNDTTGVVARIGIRASIIRTAESAEIIVPNGNLISSQVTNWTLSSRERGMCIPLTLGSAVDPAKVIELLTRIAAAQPQVTRVPAPQAFLTKLGPDSFSYELRVWTSVADQWVKTRSELAVALNAELVKENIPIK